MRRENHKGNKIKGAATEKHVVAIAATFGQDATASQNKR